MTGVGTLAVEYRVLGPLRVLRDGDEVELGGPRQRRLLMRLLLGGREGVRDDRRVADGLDGAGVRRPEATLRNSAVSWINNTAAVKQQIIREALGLGPLSSAW